MTKKRGPHRTMLFGSLLLLAVSADAQVLPGQNPAAVAGQLSAFELATVRPNVSMKALTMIDLTIPGRTVATHVTLEYLILFAYGIRKNQVLTSPDWIRSEYFDVQGKISENDARLLNTLPGIDRYNSVRRMMQGLLEDRFGLEVVHRPAVLPVYALTISKNGAHLTPPSGRFGMSELNGNLTMYGGKISDLCNYFGADLRSPVLDHTGLSGVYDVILEWDPSRTLPDADLSLENIRSVKPSLQEAITDQLGLDLKQSKEPIDAIDVVSVHRPTPN